MTQIDTGRLHKSFGISIKGLTIEENTPTTDLAFLRDAINTYSVVCLSDQDMSDAKQLALTRALGEPEPEHVTYGKSGKVVYFGTVGNVADDGTKRGNSDASTRYQTGNQLWHSDSSFRVVPTSYSILHAYEVPETGGATEFASMRVAYENLPDELSASIDSLNVIHDYVFSRSQVAPVDPNHAASLPPVMHPLVFANPQNGLKNYFVGSHARSIPGYSGIESRKLLDDLLDRATLPNEIYSHQWRVGDTIIWDNRCTLHRGTPYDADKWRRRLRQTRVIGTHKGVLLGC